MYRLIKKSEIKQAAKYLVESFYNYPLYNEFFKTEKEKKIGLYLFSYSRLYTRRKFTFVNDDLKVLFTFKRPEDKEKSLATLVFRPSIFFSYIFRVPRHVNKTVKEFGKFEREIQSKFYNPEKDCYLQMLSIHKSARLLEEGDFTKIIDDVIEPMTKGREVYLETHTLLLKRLYEMKNAKLVDESQFRNTKQFTMRWISRRK